MKNYIFGLCGILITIASCRKVDDSSVFNQSADQRLNAALAKYQTKLSGAQYGWKGVVETSAGGNYTFYFSFNDSNRVTMLSSFDSTSAVTLKESSFRLKALQQPSLLFDTYSYLHVLADPNPVVNGGEAGAGLVSDFEFYFDDVNSTDSVIALVGRYNGTKTTLTRATQQEQAAFLSGGLAKGLLINKILNYYKRIVINNTDSTDAFVQSANSYFITTDADGNLLDESLGANYTLKLGGLTFSTPVTIGTKTITEISNLSYDAATNSITGTADGQPLVIRGTTTPIKVDLAAPRRWWTVAQADDNYPYWNSDYGFHINGVDDAFNITSIPGYVVTVFWPQYGTASGVQYDFVSPITEAGIPDRTRRFGPALRPPVFNAAGKVVFTPVGSGILNPAQIPAGFNPNVTSLKTQLAIPQGYYLVQISNDPSSPAYHMVSALDGKAWIEWYR